MTTETAVYRGQSDSANWGLEPHARTDFNLSFVLESLELSACPLEVIRCARDVTSHGPTPTAAMHTMLNKAGSTVRVQLLNS